MMRLAGKTALGKKGAREIGRAICVEKAHKTTKATSGMVMKFLSQAAPHSKPHVVVYDSPKAAVVSVTQSVALELTQHKFRIDAITPRADDTPIWGNVDRLFAKYKNRDLSENKKLVAEAVPLGHMGLPEEIADTCVFLASDEVRYITAQTLNVDGGNWMN